MNMFSKKYQQGQVLLIVIMLLATVLTVVVSLTFKTTTDTQTAKLEEEQQKALAAAEAAIEQAVQKSNGNNTVTLTGTAYADFSSVQATVATVSNKTTFVSPTIEKDQQYTVYIANYNAQSGNFGSPYNGNITIYYGSGSCTSVAIEVTIISGTPGNYTLKRYLSDHGDLFGSSVSNEIAGSTTPASIEGTTFNCATSAIAFNPGNQSKLMIVRALNSPTRIGLQGTNNLATQGKLITSEANAKTGVTKKVELFQSYPQLPADFFVTSF